MVESNRWWIAEMSLADIKIARTSRIKVRDNPLRGHDNTVYFCRNYYLAKNPDVALSGMDPIKHYKQYGWKEGRDPSPVFSTKHYIQEAQLDINGNVDPLMHYEGLGRRKAIRMRRPRPIDFSVAAA